MALNPLYGIEQLPPTSQAAIREFQDRYLAALTAAKPTGWADRFGELIPSESPLVTFPVSQLRTLYKRSTGESHFKKLREKSFDIKTEEFDDGYQAKLYDILKKVFAYRRWQEAPGRFVTAEEQFRHNAVAALLELGTTTTCVDGKTFFATDHPSNMTDRSVPGTWSNYQATPKDVVDISNIEAEVTAMMAVKDENGQELGVYPDTIVVPTPKYEPLKNLLAKNLILDVDGSSFAATDNPYKGRFTVERAKELTDVNDWYLVDSKMIGEGVTPWAIVRETIPEQLGLRVLDEASDFFKLSGNLGISSHIWYGVGLALPHAIRLIRGA